MVFVALKPKGACIRGLRSINFNVMHCAEPYTKNIMPRATTSASNIPGYKSYHSAVHWIGLLFEDARWI